MPGAGAESHPEHICGHDRQPGAAGRGGVLRGQVDLDQEGGINVLQTVRRSVGPGLEQTSAAKGEVVYKLRARGLA